MVHKLLAGDAKRIFPPHKVTPGLSEASKRSKLAQELRNTQARDLLTLLKPAGQFEVKHEATYTSVNVHFILKDDAEKFADIVHEVLTGELPT